MKIHLYHARGGSWPLLPDDHEIEKTDNKLRPFLKISVTRSIDILACEEVINLSLRRIRSMKGMNFTMPVRVITSAVLACSLMFLAVSCSNPPDFSVSGSASVNLQTGAPTLTGTATWTWKHQPLQKFALFAPPPLSGASLASLDPTQAILTYSLTNATIASTGGTVTVTVADGTTGTTIGQQEFAYDVRGNSLFAHDPAAVSSWLQEFSAYSLVDVTMTANTAMTTTSPGTASFTSNAVYQGVTYASVSASWTSNPIGGGGGCHTRICPNQ